MNAEQREKLKLQFFVYFAEGFRVDGCFCGGRGRAIYPLLNSGFPQSGALFTMLTYAFDVSEVNLYQISTTKFYTK